MEAALQAYQGANEEGADDTQRHYRELVVQSFAARMALTGPSTDTTFRISLKGLLFLEQRIEHHHQGDRRQHENANSLHRRRNAERIAEALRRIIEQV
jgi:hypothetical protein